MKPNGSLKEQQKEQIIQLTKKDDKVQIVLEKETETKGCVLQILKSLLGSNYTILCQ